MKGIFGCDEHLAGTMPSRGSELCTVVETMFSYDIAFQILGNSSYADHTEKIALNALQATLFSGCSKFRNLIKNRRYLGASIPTTVK